MKHFEAREHKTLFVSDSGLQDGVSECCFLFKCFSPTLSGRTRTGGPPYQLGPSWGGEGRKDGSGNSGAHLRPVVHLIFIEWLAMAQWRYLTDCNTHYPESAV